MDSRYIVRYGATRTVAEFGSKGRDVYARNAPVILRSDRGVEWGTVLCPATDRTREFLGAQEVKGQILRNASLEDRQRYHEVRQKEQDDFAEGKAVILQHKLNMQLVDIERLFGNERLIFYYVAEGRVDFRELVKSLAGKFRVRIEMRQIGIRDEAKLLADYGDCGKPVCCNTHLREMPPVTMKMAKMQKATLDPAKISGRCGRLKCCLRYEFDTYEEYRKELPPVGAMVVTKTGQGKVVNQEILSRRVLVQFEDNRHILVDLPDIVTVIARGKRPPQKSDADDEVSQ